MGLFHDPLSVFLLPPPGETPEARVIREHREAEEKRISDIIDEGIRKEKAALKKQNFVRVLLLGQAESGKSTTLKNFRVKYAYEEWVRERAGWRSVIQLNLIRSVLTIIDNLRAETPAVPAFPSNDSSDFEDDSPVGPSSTLSSENIQRLLLKLGPLRTVEQELKQRLGAGTEEVRAESVSTTSEADAAAATPRLQRPKEFCVRRWNDVLGVASEAAADLQRPPSKQSGFQGWDEPTEVIASCKDDMKSLWMDPCVRDVLEKRNIQLNLSAGFFLDDLDRVATRDYEPSDEDILRARLRTVGVQEYRMRIQSTMKRTPSDWIFFDVGGARTMRASWMPFFDNIHAIIFLAPISTFDEWLLEDRKVNRLEDSVMLWKTICASKLLLKVTLVLFLNKCDILKQKIKSGIQVSKYLSHYGNRPNEPGAVLKYMREKFMLIMNESSPDPGRATYYHATAVTDIKATSKTLLAVQDSILRENLRASELV